MRHIVGILLGCTLLFTAPETSNAKSLRQVRTPAENPPASFKGKQYVDSRGCVFIRSGFGGKVTWVPRVNRKRQVYCSPQNRPSLSGSQLAALGHKPVIADTTVAKAPTVKKVVKQRTVTKVVAKPVLSKKTVRKAAPTKIAVPPKEVRRVVAVAPPKVVAKPTVRRVVKTTQPVATSGTTRKQVHPGDLLRARRNGNPAPQATTRGRKINTGGQQVHPGDLMRSRRLRAATQANASVYAPAKVTNIRQVSASNSTDRVYGYTTVGTTIEADVSAKGDAQTELIWTNTVPRRLVKAKVKARQVRVAAVNTVVSSKNYVAAKPKAQTSSKARYVQVATFGDPANASRTMQRFQGSGLPVSARNSARGGKSYKIVYLGPFNSSAQLQSAMSAARRAGFGDAVYR